MQDLTNAISVLSAMITPAVLISACASLILATSARLTRVVDRVRELADDMEKLGKGDAPDGKLGNIYRQLDRAVSRARLLRRAMTRLYLALSFFVGTSVAIGLAAALQSSYAWIAMVLGLIGAGLLFSSSLVLIIESQLGLVATYDEMDYILALGRESVPEELRKVKRERGFWF